MNTFILSCILIIKFSCIVDSSAALPKGALPDIQIKETGRNCRRAECEPYVYKAPKYTKCPNGDCTTNTKVAPDLTGNCPNGDCMINTKVAPDNKGNCPNGDCMTNSIFTPEHTGNCPNGDCTINTKVAPDNMGNCPNGDCMTNTIFTPDRSGNCHDGNCMTNTIFTPDSTGNCPNGDCMTNKIFLPDHTGNCLHGDCKNNNIFAPDRTVLPTCNLDSQRKLCDAVEIQAFCQDQKWITQTKTVDPPIYDTYEYWPWPQLPEKPWPKFKGRYEE